MSTSRSVIHALSLSKLCCGLSGKKDMIYLTGGDRWEGTMPPSAQLFSRLVCLLLIVNSAFVAPATVQRQRRQAFDFSSNADGADNHVDGESTTTSWQDSHFNFNGGAGNVNVGNEGMSFNFENADTKWDASEKAPIVPADGNVGDHGFANENNSPDTAHVDPDYNADHFYPGYDYYYGTYDDEDGLAPCEEVCITQCLNVGECNISKCVDYSCPSYINDYYDDTQPPIQGQNGDAQYICERDCLLPCQVFGTCGEPHCANYDCDSDSGVEGSDSCEHKCKAECLLTYNCTVPECANYSCPKDYYNATQPTKDAPQNTSSHAVNLPNAPQKTSNVPGSTTPRPVNKRICKGHGPRIVCAHGVCIGGMCLCDKGWDGFVCDYPCTRECVYGNCKIRPEIKLNGTKPSEVTEEDMFCNCEHNYREHGCTEEIVDEAALAKEKGRRLAIILGVCLTLAILTSIILPIVLWRKRVIFVMKVVYFFRLWEDNDGKKYDAYISAGTTGSALKFVRNVLAPQLEQQGFKLFIPSRDQLCGAVISEDIITAIKQSRRTIMVVTPEYLQNDWSGFEVLNAQVEMIKLQQRIIPIILEDVSEEAPRMRKSLKHILESVKCLKVPGYKSASTEFSLMSSSESKRNIYKFWRRLVLTMPKKRELVSSCESSCYIQKDLPEQQNMLNGNYSRSLPDSKISTDRDQAYASIDVNLGDFHTKSYDTMAASKINPLSIYQISSNNEDIDISKYEQCFNFKTAL